MKDSTREEIVGAIAEVLTDSGLVVSPNMVEDKYEPRSALASMLQAFPYGSIGVICLRGTRSAGLQRQCSPGYLAPCWS